MVGRTYTFWKPIMYIYLCNTSYDLRQKFLVHKLSNSYFKIFVFDDGPSLPKHVARKFNPFPPQLHLWSVGVCCGTEASRLHIGYGNFTVEFADTAVPGFCMLVTCIRLVT